MLQHLSAVFVGAVFVGLVQVHGESLKVGPNQIEALNILIKINVDVNLKVYEYKVKIPEWQNQFEITSKNFTDALNTTISDINYATAKKIHDLEAEAASKGEAGFECITNAYQYLASLLPPANFYPSCVTNLSGALSRNLGEILNRVNSVAYEANNWLTTYINCETNEACFANIIPRLNDVLTEMTGRIDTYIKNMDDYVLDMCTVRLDYCDTSETFSTGCETLLDNYRICIDNA